MKHALLLMALAAAGCGGPSAPTIPPTPPASVYPDMLGGWAGTQADTWVALDGTQPGGRACNEAWLITSQIGGSFSGNFQRMQGNSDFCARAGDITGTIAPDGNITARHSGSGVAGCPVIAGDPTFRGVLSPAGNITAGTIVNLRCPFGRGEIDLRFTTSITLSRR